MTTEPDLFDTPPPADDGSNAVSLAQYAERAYLEYALSVVKGRALPDVCDGQKPVQRRILYLDAAHGPRVHDRGRAEGGEERAGRRRRARQVPPARRYGRLRRDGADGAGLRRSAIRWSTARATSARAMATAPRRCATPRRAWPRSRASCSTRLDEGTIDFIPNYDGSEFQEPRQLPARLPFVLLNGASGIAVGLATEVPSHNLREDRRRRRSRC